MNADNHLGLKEFSVSVAVVLTVVAGIFVAGILAVSTRFPMTPVLVR
jgi:hypothetical protein